MKYLAVLVVVLAVVLPLLEARSVKTDSRGLRDLSFKLKRVLTRRGDRGNQEKQQLDGSYNYRDVSSSLRDIDGCVTVECFVDPCEVSPCPDKCWSNYCGGCNAICY